MSDDEGSTSSATSSSSSSASESSSGPPSPMPELMVTNRAHRANRGNRMQKVMTEELEEGDIYKELYGGFDEVADDEQYETEESDDDQVDSDFDEADDEPKDGDPDAEAAAADRAAADEDDELPRKKQRLLPGDEKPKKKATAAPKKAPARRSANDQRARFVQLGAGAAAVGPSSSSVGASHGDTPSPSVDGEAEEGGRRKSRRSVAVVQAQEVNRRLQEREEMRVSRSLSQKPKAPVVVMTQEELLAEAKITEQANLADVAAFLKLEEERKKQKHAPVVLTGQRYIYHSRAILDPETQQPRTQNFVTFVDVPDVAHAFG
ncbi:hypothetical protein CAOG_06783 [Capsaspora owczarzaki ATCC 30864]|uniref:Vps72/YL1 N-terminal domain-containing protein n=1 Tax=Capsaspora owczarzaki (strain ATCC 30864) TaxID=595528 RepID=A0A0D2VXQ2_CAPO3|nr:hypothetical protein CAOG_06783 [Capsaspora owczarzaki ATCC 30864]KJE96457.1 hypothetical protein CAOG_006783 [Capsaspora owczarzaki ATCC 30864]|eukprot:XP_004344404.1 hypothetical protein CAOG_06783 [Capsaspora owczarzaki ATCC 30864]